MKIPEGFTPRGDSNEQPPETYNKSVSVLFATVMAHIPTEERFVQIPVRANSCPWKVPDGPMRIVAYKVLS